MPGRFLTPYDMYEAKRAMQIYNSKVKRGEISEKDLTRLHLSVCGCGAEGCLFVSQQKKSNWG